MTALTEPAGWGEPGTVRHAELIGHGVWLAGHPIPAGADGLDPTPVDDLESWHDAYDPGGPLDRLIERTFGEHMPRCPVARCVRPEHPLWEMHQDAQGNGWFPGEAPR